MNAKENEVGEKEDEEKKPEGKKIHSREDDKKIPDKAFVVFIATKTELSVASFDRSYSKW